jgi:transposase-like protein
MLSDIDFNAFRKEQYCDHPTCRCYQKKYGDNLRLKSRKNDQLYCNACNRSFSVRRGTMFYNLCTDINKVITTLQLVVSGMGVNAIYRQTRVRPETIASWLVLASNQVAAFSEYMQVNMHLEQVQIDEFWSFVRKKKKI